MKRKKTIVEYKYPSVFHPIIANIIRENQWVPLVVRRGKSAYWNCSSAKDGKGQTFGISSDTCDQFFREIHEGRFGEEAKQIIIDVSAYESIYDILVTWPDQERIASEDLGLVELCLVDGDRFQGSELPGVAANSVASMRAQEDQRVSISLVVAEIERRAMTRKIGRLQEIRKELKGKSRLPWHGIFHKKTIQENDNYAFHYGGRTELQFNIGVEPHNMFRHGVAFSFETSKTLPDPTRLLLSVQRFNEFLRLQQQPLENFVMWNWKGSVRSEDYPIAPIRPDQMMSGLFVFLGRMQPLHAIDFELLLDDLDRLLPLYCFVEGTAASPLTSKSDEPRFQFRAGCTAKVTGTTVSLVERRLNIALRHNELQKQLHDRLVLQYGAENVGTELDNGGGQVDLVVRRGSEYWFYEIKTAISARGCIREAISQLLEYSFWPGTQEAKKLIVVGEPALDLEAEQYLATLRTRFSLPIEYYQIE